MTEAVVLEAYGVDTEAAVSVHSAGLGGNVVLECKAAGMLRGDFAPGSRSELHHRTWACTSAAREAAVVIPLGAHVAQLVASASSSAGSALGELGRHSGTGGALNRDFWPP